MHLEAGRSYAWCRCGRSRQQPFCDGSHAGSGQQPLRFTPPRSRIYWLCNCKYTRTPPWCDAAHNRLPELHQRRLAAQPSVST
ncbi:MAG: CDGSH iron-sulfur domain-containing protein, partial [Perlucidibaca sp.]